MRVYLALLLSLVSPVLWADANQASAPVNGLVDKSYHVTGFDRIVADGYYNLSLSNRGGQDQSVLHAASYPEAPITISVHDRTLYIISRYASEGPYAYYQGRPHPHVELSLPLLSGLSVYGPVNVHAKNVPTNGLSLVSEGYGSIELDGVGSLRNIKQSGTSVIKAYGVSTDILSLDATGSADLSLEGHANYLYARVNNQAKLHAQNLVAKHVVVQARANAQAAVNPIESLRAYTDQSGAIYYTKHLKNLTLVPTQSGNVYELQKPAAPANNR